MRLDTAAIFRAALLVALITVIGALVGYPLVGLAVGLAFVLVAQFA